VKSNVYDTKKIIWTNCNILWTYKLSSNVLNMLDMVHTLYCLRIQKIEIRTIFGFSLYTASLQVALISKKYIRNLENWDYQKMSMCIITNIKN